MSAIHPSEVYDLDDAQLLTHLEALDTLMVEAKGEHPALADVRRQIGEQIDIVLTEAKARGLAIVEPF